MGESRRFLYLWRIVATVAMSSMLLGFARGPTDPLVNPPPEGTMIVAGCPELPSVHIFLECPGADVLGTGASSNEIMKTAPEVFVLDSEGGNRRITDNNVIEFSPVVSPGRRRIALSVTDVFDDIPDCSLYTYSTARVDPQELTDYYGGCNYATDWSENGWVLYETWGNEPENYLYKVRADGSRDTNLTPFPGETPTAYAGQWALNDTAIVFFGSGEFHPAGIWMMDLDGGNLRAVAVAGNGKDRFASPEVSPSGEAVAYQRAEGGSSYDIFLTSLGGRTRRLTRTKVSEERLAWSPDGKKLAVVLNHERPQEAEIAVIDARTRQMTTLPAPENLVVSRHVPPQWSPSGRYIAFGAELSAVEAPGIFAIDMKDFSFTQITRFDSGTNLFAWYGPP